MPVIVPGAIVGSPIKNEVKAVGEVIPLNFVLEGLSYANNDLAPNRRIIDFEIDSNYVLTDLEVTKTVNDLKKGGAGETSDQLTIEVYRVGPGPDAVATETLIAKSQFDATSADVVVGTRTLAGDPYSADSQQFANGTEQDPLVEVSATTTAVVTNGVPNSRQRIRVVVTMTASDATSRVGVGSASCFIKVSLVRFSQLGNLDELITLP